MISDENEIIGALDELSKRINSKHSKDIVAGINIAEKFQDDIILKNENENEKGLVEKDNKVALVNSMRSIDMGDER